MSVKVISHRGANKYAPQNTLAAFKKSFEIGVDGVETDVHITADNVPVICHNYGVDMTSDGKGLITKMTLDQFKSYDFGSYFNEKYKGTLAPTLDEFLSLCQKSQFEIMNIEIKPSKENDITVVHKTIDMVKQFGLFDKLLISSFSSRMLIEAKKADRNCATAYLYSPEKKEALRMWYRAGKFAREIGACAIHPNKYYVNQKYVEEAHGEGIKVNVWTVNKEKEILRLAEYGVDGIITDVPDIANEVLIKAGFKTKQD